MMPPPPSFCCWLCNKKHAQHKQQEQEHTEKGEWKRSLPFSMKIVAKKQRKKVNASYSGSFLANVKLSKIPSICLYIIHMNMALNSKVSLV